MITRIQLIRLGLMLIFLTHLYFEYIKIYNTLNY